MKHALVLCFLLGFQNVFGQFEESNLYLGAKGGYLNIENYYPRYYAGVSLEWQINDHWSLNYNIEAGENYVQIPAGTIAGVATALLVTIGLGALHVRPDELTWNIIKYAAMIPGGAGYRFGLGENIRFMPYINPFIWEYVANNSSLETDDSFRFFAGSAGVKFQFLMFNKTMQLAPYAEFRYHLTPDWHPGFSFGFVLSARIKDGLVKE